MKANLCLSNCKPILAFTIFLLMFLTPTHAEYKAYVISYNHISSTINATSSAYFEYVQSWTRDDCNDDDDYLITLEIPLEAVFWNITPYDFVLYCDGKPYLPPIVVYNTLNEVTVKYYNIDCDNVKHVVNFTADASNPLFIYSLYWNWTELKYYWIGWRYCLNFQPITNITYILTPNLAFMWEKEGLQEVERYKYRSAEWFYGKRNYGVYYVGDSITLGSYIANLDIDLTKGMGGATAYDTNGYFEIKSGADKISCTSLTFKMGDVLYKEEKASIIDEPCIAEDVGIVFVNLTVNSTGGYFITEEYPFAIFNPFVKVKAPKEISYSQPFNITINITNNATNIRDIYVVMKYFDVEENKYAYQNITLSEEPLLFHVIDNKTIEKYDGDLLVNLTYYIAYNFTYNAPYSGAYDYNVTVIFDNWDQTRIAKGSFYIKEGKLLLKASHPSYRILPNQTGNITLVFMVKDGDLINLNLYLNSTFFDALNILEPYKWLYLNLTNGTEFNVSWEIETYDILAVVYLNLTYESNTTSWKKVDDKYVEISLPKIFYSQNPLSLDNRADAYMEIRTVGNLSGLGSLTYLLNMTLFGNVIEGNILFDVVLTENECYAEEQQSGANLAESASVLATSYVDYAYDAIDGDYLTKAVFNEYVAGSANLTIQLDNAYLLYKISIYGSKSLSEGEGIIHYYYYDSNQDKYIETKETSSFSYELPVEASYVNTTFINAFKTDKIIVEIRGNATSYIHEINIYAAKIDSDEPCYIYNISLSNINASGKVSVDYSLFLEPPISNSLKVQDSFDVLFGKPAIYFCSGGSYCSSEGLENIYLTGQTKVLNYIFIRAIGGDLYDLDVNLTISNTSLINISDTETNIKHISYISYVDQQESTTNKAYLVKYNLTSYMFYEETNVTLNVTVNSTFLKVFAYNDTGIIKLYPQDAEPPVLYWFYIAKADISTGEWYNYTKSNAYIPIYVVFNASDNIGITSAILEVVYPDGNATNLTITHYDFSFLQGGVSSGLFYFNSDYKVLNTTGNFSIRVYVEDFGGNITTNNQTYRNLSVVDTLYVYITPYKSVYNRGQEILIQAKDINNEFLGFNLNITYNITGNNSFESITCDDLGSLSTFSTFFNIFCEGNRMRVQIPTDEIPSSYITNVSVQYYINKGKLIGHAFSTSDKLKLVRYIAPTLPSGNSTLQLMYISIYVTYQNDINIIDDFLEDNLDLLEPNVLKCSNTQETKITSFSNIEIIDEEPYLKSPNLFMTLPVDFEINIGYNNNTLDYSSTITYLSGGSSTSSSGGSSSGGGGGGGGGFGFISPYYNYTPPPTNLTFLEVSIVDVGMGNITQGSFRYFHIEYENKGKEYLLTNTTIYSDCLGCLIEPNTTSLVLAPTSSLTSDHKLYVPLYQPPGSYSIFVNIQDNKEESYNKVIPFIVYEHPSVTILKRINKRLENLKKDLMFLESLGINVDEGWAIATEIENEIKSAEQSIQQDNLTLLTMHLDTSDKHFEELINYLASKEFAKFFKLHQDEIFAYGLAAFVAAIIMSFYILPMLGIMLKIKQLKRKQKLIIETRKETEKEYFNRKIDEITFRRIMEQEQDKFLTIKKELEKLETELKLMANFKFLTLRKFRKELEYRKKKMDEMKKIEEKSKRGLSKLFNFKLKKPKSKLKDIEKDEIKYEVIKPKVIQVKTENLTQFLENMKHGAEPSSNDKKETSKKDIPQTAPFQEAAHSQHNANEDLDEIMLKIKKMLKDEDVERT